MYYFTSNRQKEKILSICFGNNNCIWIESIAGMGGTTLMKFMCDELQLKSFSVKKIEFYNLIKNIQTDQSALLQQEIISIDGFQNIYDEETESISLLEQFLINFFKKGGRLIVKANPTKNMVRFKQFISGHQYHKILLHRMNKKVKKRLLNNIVKEFNINWEENDIETILSLEFSNYRVFENIFLIASAKATLQGKMLSKEMILDMYKEWR
ncbi:MAG TPA: hypothetical protein VFW07_14000 [Parafilimonas sp.]|nr:hypothetical protein [Parafilimonas sp.]